MKVKILLKNIKEGVSRTGSPYCIKSLYACVSSKEDANSLAVQAISDGVPVDKIQEVIKPKEYEGVTSYAFGLNCSHFTFDRVERFGTLDCKVEFVVNKDGFVNPKIQVVDKKEQIFGYEPPEPQEEEVTGWESPAPDVKGPESKADYNFPDSSPLPPFPEPVAGDNPADDLPF
jgi:hypothetical protein